MTWTIRGLFALGLLLTVRHSGCLAQEVIPIGKTKKVPLSNLCVCWFNKTLCGFSGAIFEVGTDEMQAAFRHAVAQFNRMNESSSGRRYELQAFVDIISTADTVKLSKLSKFVFRRFREWLLDGLALRPDAKVKSETLHNK